MPRGGPPTESAFGLIRRRALERLAHADSRPVSPKRPCYNSLRSGSPMSLKKTEWIWHNGKLIPWDQAQIHVLSHVVSYGSSVFEGIRCYETKHGPAAFRLREH